MKNLLALSLIVFLTANVLGQAPLNADDITTTIGTQFSYYGTIPQEPGDPGTDQTWDFSNMTVQVQQSIEIQDMESTGVESNFPDANVQWVRNLGVSSFFYALNSDSLAYYGEYEDGGYQLIYEDPTTFIRFPATVGNTFEDTFVSNYVINGGSSHVEGTFNGEVDGVGTLIMPWGEVQNAYRVSAFDNHTEDFDAGPATYAATYTGTSTQWFAAGYPGPLLTITSGVLTVPELNFTQDQNVTTFLGDFTFVGIDEVEIVKQLNVWPVPAKDELNLSFENQSSEPIQLSLFDVGGKKLLQWTAKPTDGFKYVVQPGCFRYFTRVLSPATSVRERNSKREGYNSISVLPQASFP